MPSVALCGAYQFDASLTHPLLDDLPEIVHLPARLGHHPELRAAVELLGAELDNPRLGADAAVRPSSIYSCCTFSAPGSPTSPSTARPPAGPQRSETRR